jgi:hypothetical protein
VTDGIGERTVRYRKTKPALSSVPNPLLGSQPLDVTQPDNHQTRRLHENPDHTHHPQQSKVTTHPTLAANNTNPTPQPTLNPVTPQSPGKQPWAPSAGRGKAGPGGAGQGEVDG